MDLSSSISLFKSRPRPRQVLRRHHYWGSLLPSFSQLACMLIIFMAVVMVVVFLPPSWTKEKLLMMMMKQTTPTGTVLEGRINMDNIIIYNTSKTTPTAYQFQTQSRESDPTPQAQGGGPALPSSTQQLQSQMITNASSTAGPYHNWLLFSKDYREMLRNLKIFVYPHVQTGSLYDSIFLPLANPRSNPKLGNYYSEHAFKVALLHSSLVTKRPEEANFFFMPFSINAMRNHPNLHSASSISDFVAQYTTRISSESAYWNASGGADHFYVCCHSIAREAASNHPALHNNAIQVTCSSSYFQRLYITHKDIGLPQVWPRLRHPDQSAVTPDTRNILVFFAGRAQNSLIRQKILDAWSNDTSFVISSGGSSLPYEEGFRRSKYCLHIRGYEVNTARISDAIHYGCIPVIISNYYDLPFANILNWSEFSILISEGDFKLLKKILSSVSKQMYQRLYKNLCLVRRHFAWHTTPTSYDAFYMTAYQLWLRRGLNRLAEYASPTKVIDSHVSIE